MSRLADLRKAAGLSQSRLAEASGLPVGVIRHYEQGYRDINGIGLKRALALANALGCRMEELFEEEETKWAMI